MRLSKTSALAALAVAHLAQADPHAPVQARQVGKHLGIPTDSALKILQSLARGRVISSQLGRSGGYYLRKPPATITLLQIVEAIDGPLDAQVPLDHSDKHLAQGVDRLQAVCEAAMQRVRQELSQLTVADLADVDHRRILAPTG